MDEKLLKVGAVVLAAGASRRMGRPKMTLPFHGSTVIGTVLTQLNSAGIAPLIAVVGGAGEEVEGILRRLPFEVKITRNLNFAATDMLESLKIGMNVLPSDLDAFLVVLGDQPQIQIGVISSIVAEYKSRREGMIIPSYQMRRGHPWLVDRSLWRALHNLQRSQTMRDFIQSHQEQIRYLSVDTPSILEDLDTPADYQRAVG